MIFEGKDHQIKEEDWVAVPVKKGKIQGVQYGNALF